MIHRFRLVLSYVGELPDVEALLLEPGCDDVAHNTSCGSLTLAFAKEAPSFREALVSAMLGVEKIGFRVEYLLS